MNVLSFSGLRDAEIARPMPTQQQTKNNGSPFGTLLDPSGDHGKCHETGDPDPSGGDVDHFFAPPLGKVDGPSPKNRYNTPFSPKPKLGGTVCWCGKLGSAFQVTAVGSEDRLTLRRCGLGTS